MVNLPLSKETYDEEYSQILKAAEKNGFRKKLVDKKIETFKKQKQIKTITTLASEKEKTIFKKFTFHPWATQKFQKIFKEYNISLSAYNKYSIKNLTNTNHCDKIPKGKKAGIYQINCSKCNETYIGKTKRNIDTRLKEHLRNIKYCQIDKSAVAAHCWNKNHHILKEANLLKSVNKQKDLEVWEKIYMKKYEDKLMNFEIPLEENLIKKFVKPKPEGASVLQAENRQLTSS